MPNFNLSRNSLLSIKSRALNTSNPCWGNRKIRTWTNERETEENNTEDSVNRNQLQAQSESCNCHNLLVECKWKGMTVVWTFDYCKCLPLQDEEFPSVRIIHLIQPQTHHFCEDQAILDQVQQWRLAGYIVEGVSGLELLMNRVMHDGGWESVEADHVRDFLIFILWGTHINTWVNSRARKEWSMSNFPCSFTRNITSNSTKNTDCIAYSDVRWLYYQFSLTQL